MPVLFTNNASTTLASGIAAGATSITVATGQGALFPTISGSNFFYATLANSSNVLEIVKVTARSGDVMTVTRGQDGTTATAYNTGDKFELRPTAASLAWKVDQDFAGSLTGNLTFTGTTTFNSTVSGTGFTTAIGSYLAAPGAVGGTTPNTAAFTTLTANSLVVNGATVPANGVYLSTTNTLAFSSASTARGTINANGVWTLNAPASGNNTLVVGGVTGTHSMKVADSATSTFNAGYLETPVSGQTAAYQTVLADSGKTIYYTGSTSVTMTISGNTTGTNPVAYPVGTVLSFVNDASAAVTILIAIAGTDTLQWVTGGTTGTRTLARYGMATAVKVTSTKWVISGAGLT